MCWAGETFSVRPLVLRYEDMVSRPKQSITKIFNHLQLDVSGNLNDILAKTSFKALKEQEVKAGFAEQSGREMFSEVVKLDHGKITITTFLKLHVNSRQL